MTESDYIHLPEEDFRRQRFLFAPHLFALSSEEPDLPPRDLVPRDDWDSVMNLPTDVVLRTSSHQGNTFAALHQLESGWVFSWPDPGVCPSMDEIQLLAGEEFDALVFNAVHGYYRQAVGCLRNALEVMTVGAALTVHSNPELYEKWRRGQEVSFGQSCVWLRESVPGLQVEGAAAPLGIFGRNAKDSDAWFRKLYSRLCGYAHSRAGYNNADFWESNGPVHVPSALVTVENEFRETLAACYLLLKIAWPGLGRTEGIEFVFSKPTPNMTEYVPFLNNILT
ncbi:hypothetical protein ACIRVK_03815 [Streptomyces sp. NPDC101152]|uniref:hypothetical protein n=1 Tax=Streptomyces sp. NPDC101152 TaxID=3366116 RepID=UPI00380771A2